MYSNEISQMLESYNWDIDSKTYIHMIQDSPQIDHVKYNPYSDTYEMWDSSGEYWSFHVHNNME